jgi:hypothetical protein
VTFPLEEQIVMSKRIVRTSTFKAVNDAGDEFEIDVYTTFVDTSTLGQRNELPTGRQLRTSDGDAVNWKEKGVYQIVATGMIVRSSDPKAP